MSIFIRYRKDTSINGNNLNRILTIKCNTCGVEFTYVCSKNPKKCPACLKDLPTRLKFLPNYYSARLFYYKNI